MTRTNLMLTYVLTRPQDMEVANSFLKDSLGLSATKREVAVSGRNWGEVEFEGKQGYASCLSGPITVHVYTGVGKWIAGGGVF